VSAAAYVTEAAKQKLNLTSDTILKPIQDTAKRAKKAAVGDIPVPPKYTSADFLSTNFWRLRGKLDVPKERWVSFPHCEGEDGTLVIAWAGYDHLQLARAIAERYELAKEQEGRKLLPLLAAIGQLIPWLKQWHNELDPAYGTRMGDYFENYLAEEAKALDMSVEQVMDWTPPEKRGSKGQRGRGAKGQRGRGAEGQRGRRSSSMNDQSPNVVVVAGPNGSGKSTAAPALRRDYLGITEFVNAWMMFDNSPRDGFELIASRREDAKCLRQNYLYKLVLVN